MGEYAEMMLDGSCCEGCGEWLGETVGYPQYCASCSIDNESSALSRPEPAGNRTCDICGKTCKSVDGVAMHKIAKHSPKREPLPDIDDDFDLIDDEEYPL